MAPTIAIDTLLVANRGEIALRIIRTAPSASACAPSPSSPPPTRTRRTCGPPTSGRVASYLDVDAVVGGCPRSRRRRGAPGLRIPLRAGRRSPRALEDAGITLVGPSAAVMEQMGRKDAAREIAIAAGVPVVPRGEDAAKNWMARCWSRPLPAVAARGCGSCASEAELAEATAAAKREALSAFGDDTMLIEKYVEHGRHIEVQVLGDTHGNVAHLARARLLHPTSPPEGDWRRRRPRPISEQCARWSPAAVALAKHVGYVGAGTVEFLLDSETDEVYFLEMNTRLQVEHPVTEAMRRQRRPGRATAPDRRRSSRCVSPEEGGRGPQRSRHRGARLRRGPVHGFLPQAGTASIVRWPDDREHPRRPRPRERPGRRHQLRPDARQDRGARARPRGRPPAAGAGARAHRHPRPDHQRRLPARAGGQRRLPRRHHRHRLARHGRDREAERRRAAHRRGLGVGDAHGQRHRAPVRRRRLALRRSGRTHHRRARPAGRRRPRGRHRRRRAGACSSPPPTTRCGWSSTAPPTTRRSTPNPASWTSSCAASASSSPSPTGWPAPPRSVTARSPRRCPARCSTSGSRSATRWSRVTCSA